MFVFNLSDIVVLALGIVAIIMLLGLFVASGIKALINKARQTERSK